MKTGIVRRVKKDSVIVSPIAYKNEIEVKSRWQLEEGDIVKFAYFIPKIYFYSFIRYVVPFLDFILFYLISYYVVRYYFPQYMNILLPITFTGGVAGFVISKALSIYMDKNTTLLDEYKPVVLAVMKRRQDEQNSDS